MKLVKKNWARILTVLAVICLMGVQVFATGIGTAGEAQFMEIMKTMARWMQYVGLAIGFFGAVQLGFGFRSDDAEAKSKGMRSMIAGFIVFGISASITYFFAL